MKIFESEHIFNYAWDQVSAANWAKYPNENSTHVVAVDTLRREIDPVSNVLRTERLITCEQKIPKWLQMCIGASRSYVREVSEVDPVKQTLVMRSCNMSYNNLLKVYEVVSYKPHDATKTKFEQFAEFEAYLSFKKLTDKIEEWSVERFGINAQSGRLGFEKVLKLFSENLEKSSQLIDRYKETAIGEVNDVIEEVKTHFV